MDSWLTELTEAKVEIELVQSLPVGYDPSWPLDDQIDYVMARYRAYCKAAVEHPNPEYKKLYADSAAMMKMIAEDFISQSS